MASCPGPTRDVAVLFVRLTPVVGSVVAFTTFAVFVIFVDFEAFVVFVVFVAFVVFVCSVWRKCGVCGLSSSGRRSVGVPCPPASRCRPV